MSKPKKENELKQRGFELFVTREKLRDRLEQTEVELQSALNRLAVIENKKVVDKKKADEKKASEKKNLAVLVIEFDPTKQRQGAQDKDAD